MASKIKKVRGPKLRIIPLGGLGEIGKNMTVYEYQDDIIVVGSGMSGLCVAASAAEAGASVTLFSASSQPISRGGSNFSAYNKVIEEYGIERLDPVPFFWREEKAASFSIDQQMWMRGYNNSEEAMNWVIDIVRSKDVEVFLESDNRLDGGPDYAIGFGAKGDDPSASASTGQQNAVVAVATVCVTAPARNVAPGFSRKVPTLPAVLAKFTVPVTANNPPFSSTTDA